METNEGALGQVEEMALSLVDSGKFKTMQQARAHVFGTRPALADQVRDETTVQPVAKRVVLVGAEEEVEKAALDLVTNRRFPTMAQARAHVFETQPDLAVQVRKQRS